MTIMQGARPITAPGWTGKPKTDLALIDCDVHHNIKQTEDLYPYLPRVYREQVIEQGLRMPGSGYFNVATNAARTVSSVRACPSAPSNCQKLQPLGLIRRPVSVDRAYSAAVEHVE